MARHSHGRHPSGTPIIRIVPLAIAHPLADPPRSPPSRELSAANRTTRQRRRMATARRLRWLRRNSDYEIADLARAAGVSVATWARAENTGVVRVDDLEAMLAVFRVPFHAITTADHVPPALTHAPLGYFPIPLFSKDLLPQPHPDPPVFYLPVHLTQARGLSSPFAFRLDGLLTVGDRVCTTDDILFCDRRLARQGELVLVWRDGQVVVLPARDMPLAGTLGVVRGILTWRDAPTP